MELLHELPFYDKLSAVKNQIHLKDIKEVMKLK